MNRANAHLILDAVREGAPVPRWLITEALVLTGDAVPRGPIYRPYAPVPEMLPVRVFKPVGSWELRQQSNARRAGPFDVVVGSWV